MNFDMKSTGYYVLKAFNELEFHNQSPGARMTSNMIKYTIDEKNGVIKATRLVVPIPWIILHITSSASYIIITFNSKPGQNETLIKVIATGSNLKDWKVIRSCMLLNSFAYAQRDKGY